jgi:hypothetical protein
MEEYENIIFHIGIHKTGTTFLQKWVFPKLKKVQFARWKINVEETISNELKNLIISNESLSGRPWGIENGGHMTYEEKKYKSGETKEGIKGNWIRDYEKKVKGISKTFPEAEIVVCFRRHDSLLDSLYKQYVLEGGTGDVHSLFSFEPNRGLLGKKDLEFRRRIEIIEKNLKKEPYVILHSDIKKDYKKCIKGMLNYFDVPTDGLEKSEFKKEHESKGKRRYDIIKILNKAKIKRGILGRIARNDKVDGLKYKLLKYPLMDMERKISIGQEMREKVLEEYRSDWESVKRYSERQK